MNTMLIVKCVLTPIHTLISQARAAKQGERS